MCSQSSGDRYCNECFWIADIYDEAFRGSSQHTCQSSQKNLHRFGFRLWVCPMRVSRKNRRQEKPREQPRTDAHTPHDALFHYTFGNVEHARPAIQSMLPTKIAKRIDFASLAVVDGHFVDRHLSQSQT